MKSFESSDEFFDEHFTGLNFAESVVVDKEFQGCTFSKVQFSGGGFVRCRFLDCLFESSDLSNLTVKNCSFRDVRFQKTKLIGINWTDAAGFHGVRFEDSVLNFGIFVGMDLKRLVMTRCIAHEMDFSHANLMEADLKKSDLRGTQFLKTNLTKADFRGASDYTIHPVENILKGTRFSMPEATALLYQLDIVLEG